MQGMAMEGMANESMGMDGSEMQNVMTDDAGVQPSSSGIDEVTLLSTSKLSVPTNKLRLPIDSCTHCMSHSGMQNAPVSSLGVPDQSNKDSGSAPLPALRFVARPAMTPAQIGLPGEHAPPGSSPRRHILIRVFQI